MRRSTNVHVTYLLPSPLHRSPLSPPPLPHPHSRQVATVLDEVGKDEVHALCMTIRSNDHDPVPLCIPTCIYSIPLVVITECV